MDCKELYQIEIVADGVVIVFGTTYANPLSCLPVIEQELSKMNFSGKVIFDLLLSNGYSSNRFIEAEVESSRVIRKSMKVISSSDLDDNFLELTHEFFRSQPNLIEKNFILLDKEKYSLIHG